MEGSVTKMNVEVKDQRRPARSGRTSAMVLVVLLALAIGLAYGVATAAGIIATHNGALQGTEVNGVDEYLGIPYAAAPIGRLRWVPPQSFGKWSGARNATQFGNVCPQFDAITGAIIGDENCLFLNIYVPNRPSGPSTRLPVMVWIPGGGLTSGAGEFYDPTPLVQRGVIVVTINYRLGLLGFFAQTALDVPHRRVANYGFMDQQFALKWIKLNVAAFGGDPKRMTIFGESAGGQSIYCQLASPLAAGLFEGAIAESGAYSSFADYLESVIPIAQAETTGSFFEISGAAFATNVGCGSQTAACLRAVPAATLVSVQPFPMYPFVDGKLLTQTPATAFASGQFNQVPVISGTDRDEYRFFVAEDYDYVGNPLTNTNYSTAVDALWGVLAPFVLPVYPLPPSPPPDAASLALGASGTDGIFSCPARHADQSLSQFVTTYTYEFSDENAPLYFGLLPPSFPLGAYHSAEIQYLMAILGIPALFTLDQQQLSATMIDYWTQFAATGDPNLSSAPTWTPYNSITDEFQSLVPPKPAVDTTFAAYHLCSTFWDFL
jgi:para-nitrobenzyl esterase